MTPTQDGGGGVQHVLLLLVGKKRKALAHRAILAAARPERLFLLFQPSKDSGFTITALLRESRIKHALFQEQESWRLEFLHYKGNKKTQVHNLLDLGRLQKG